ncbi:hypothetical protein R3P38DRAFT_2556878, partial [Favolaschia claudopus]
FFRHVVRNRTVPFWSHPLLKPLNPELVMNPAPRAVELVSQQPTDDAVDSDDEDGMDMGSEDEEMPCWTPAERQTFDERLTSLVGTLREFADAMEYQRQFQDSRMLNTVEREGASLFRLAESCFSRERRANSTRGPQPSTWERSTVNAMFYRTRPTRNDRET